VTAATVEMAEKVETGVMVATGVMVVRVPPRNWG